MAALLVAVAVAAVVAAIAERTGLTRQGYPVTAAVCLAGALLAEAASWATGLGFRVPGFDAAMGAAVALALIPVGWRGR